jgi:hypothetical protein
MSLLSPERLNSSIPEHPPTMQGKNHFFLKKFKLPEKRPFTAQKADFRSKK